MIIPLTFYLYNDFNIQSLEIALTFKFEVTYVDAIMSVIDMTLKTFLFWLIVKYVNFGLVSLHIFVNSTN